MPNKQLVIDALNHIEDMYDTHGVTGAIELHETGYRIILRKDSRYHAHIVAWEHAEYARINPLCAAIDRMAEELCQLDRPVTYGNWYRG
jgi:hypothetical protein